MKMTDDTFAKMVAEEVKNKVTIENRQFLLQKENWERWEKALEALVMNLNNQIVNIHEDLIADEERYGSIDGGEKLLDEAKKAYESRVRKIERFKFHTENKLVQVSKMIASGVPMEDDSLRMLTLLRSAVKKHREMMEKCDLEDTPIDRALWDALDGKWSFNDISQKDFADHG